MDYKINKYGTKSWYKKGFMHRTDGPAIEGINGYKAWYKEGNLHREDGPAIEYVNGDKFWYKEGKRHRTDGPATEWSNGIKAYYYLDKYINCNSNEEYFKLLKLKAFW